MSEPNPTRLTPFGAMTIPANEVTSSSDVGLWDAYRKGSDAAYVEIYEIFFESLYAYGMRVSGDASLVKDSIHEVFIDLRELRAKVGPTDSIKFYLFTC